MKHSIVVAEKTFDLDLTLDQKYNLINDFARRLDLAMSSMKDFHHYECMRRTFSPRIRTMLAKTDEGLNPLEIMSLMQSTRFHFIEVSEKTESWKEFWDCLGWKNLWALGAIVIGLHSERLSNLPEEIAQSTFKTGLETVIEGLDLLQFAAFNPHTMHWNKSLKMVDDDPALRIWETESKIRQIKLLESLLRSV